MSEHTFGYVAGGAPVAPAAVPGRGRLRVVADRGIDDETTPPPHHDGRGPSPAEPTADDVPVDPAVALAALERAAELLARADLSRLSDRGLLEHTVTVDEQITRIEAQRVRHLWAIDRREAYVQDGCVTSGAWFKMRSRRDANAGARWRRWARRLARFDRFRASWQAGRITSEHVKVLVGYATGRRVAALLDHEDTLVTLAEAATPRDLKVAPQAIADAVDHRDPRDGHCGPAHARELYHARTFDGLGDLRGLLDPVTAERLDNLIHAYMTPDDPDTDDEQRRTPAQLRHDAFDRILQAAEDHPHAPTVQGARPHLVIYADLFTLLGRRDLASRPTTRLGSNQPIDLQHIIHLLQDARCSAVLGMGPFRPVAFGRTRRTLPGWLRVALAMIHGTCVGPGCDRPITWTQAAHADTPWAAGGTTELDTTIPACNGSPGHHQLIDLLGWNVDLDPDTATVTWTSPNRRTVLITHPPDP